MEIAPEPPGGLVPYRRGHLWGYSDTTGQIVIQVGFEHEPWPFARGFGVLELDPLTLINARGEVLRESRNQAIGFAPKGGLLLISRRGVGFRPALKGLHYPKGQREAVFDTLWLSPRNHEDRHLSDTRGLRYQHASEALNLLGLTPENLRAALVDEHGRALTKYAYAAIEPFRAGFALARRTGTSGFVLLNQQGQEVIQPRTFLDRLTNNRTLAASRLLRGQTELVDSTGRVIRTFDSHRVRWLNDGELLVAPSQPGRFGLYDRDGRTLLNGQEFAAVGEFWNNRLWVRTPAGQEGLLDRHLRWVVPAVYEALYYPTLDKSRLHHMRGSNLEAFFYDTAYMVAKQHKQYGQVAIHDGRLAVPIRYDSILVPLRQGFATVQRAGEPYIVNSQGRELIPGRASSEQAKRRDGLWQVGVRQGRQTALFDESGRQLCPWREIVTMQFGSPDNFVPRPGYGNLAIVYGIPVADRPDGDGPRLVNLVNFDGQVLLPWRYQDIAALAGVYALRFSRGSITQWELVDRQLHPLLTHPVQSVRLLPGDWLSTQQDLFHASGQSISVPDMTKQEMLCPLA